MTVLIATAAWLITCQHLRPSQAILASPAVSGGSSILDSKIAFVSNRDQLPEPKTWEPSEIYLMNGNGSDQKRLTGDDARSLEIRPERKDPDGARGRRSHASHVLGYSAG